MAVSVRVDPLLEAKLTQQAALSGMTKSEFIKDALERVLGIKNPATLLGEHLALSGRCVAALACA